MDAHELIRAALPPGGSGRRRPAPFSTIEVRGPDAADFLHRLSSQDVNGLAVGAAAPAAFLTSKGRLITTATIGRLELERLVVEVQDAGRTALLELMDRYHFTERLEILRPSEFVAADVLGLGEDAAWRCDADGDALRFAGSRRGVVWTRSHAPADAIAAWAVDRPPLEPALAECLRILAGLVEVGVDTVPSRTLALEAELGDHVSTTKGCYVGQEIVARVHTYGHVNRRMALLRIASVESAEPTTSLCIADDGTAVGRLMSSAAIPGSDQSIGLGDLPDAFFAEPADLVLDAPGRPAVTIEGIAGPGPR